MRRIILRLLAGCTALVFVKYGIWFLYKGWEQSQGTLVSASILSDIPAPYYFVSGLLAVAAGGIAGFGFLKRSVRATAAGFVLYIMAWALLYGYITIENTRLDKEMESLLGDNS